nr:rho GTPase-activating protein gacHH-like [Lytechinus pictus]
MALQCSVMNSEGASLPAPRANHASCWADSKLVVYGGNGACKNQNCLKDVWVMDTGTMTWTEVKGHGALPGARCHHTMDVIGNKAWVFGGWTGKRRCNFLHCLDLESETWTDYTSRMTHVDTHTSHASTVLDDHTILVLGRGETGTHAKYGCNIDFLDTRKFKWTNYPGSTISRAGHTLNFLPSVSTSYAVAYGGRQRHPVEHITTCKVKTPFVSPFQSGLPTSVVEEAQTVDVPAGRSYHSATSIGGTLLIYGGFIQGKSVRGLVDGVDEVFVFDAKKGQWMSPAVKGDWPKRAGHTADRIGEDKVLLFGGEHSNKQYNDCHVITW